MSNDSTLAQYEETIRAQREAGRKLVKRLQQIWAYAEQVLAAAADGNPEHQPTQRDMKEIAHMAQEALRGR